MNHPNSPLGQLERMFDSPICLVCITLGGLNSKPRNKGLCGYHLSTPPRGYKCPIYKVSEGITKCGYKGSEGSICPKHSLKLEPYWNPLPEGLEFLYSKPKLKKWHYAQISQGRGKERGLETLDRIAEVLEIGNSTIILNALEIVDLLAKEKLC